MDSQNILNQLKRISKRTFSPKYRFWNIKDIFLYENIYYSIKGKNPKSKIKIIAQYILQSIFGVYRTDYGIVNSDFIVLGSDPLISLIASCKLVEHGATVIYYPYKLNDFAEITKLFSEKRYNALPDESVKLICGDLDLPYEDSLDLESICLRIIDKMDKEKPGHFILIRNCQISSFFKVNDNEIASLIQAKAADDIFLKANELVFFDHFEKTDGFGKIRRKGRVISMLKCKSVVSTSQKTKSTPRVESGFEVSIGDAQRETQGLEELYYKDRNKDVLEALSINEKIRYLNGLSK